MTSAADTMDAPAAHIAARLVPAASSRKPLTYGASKPERFPGKLIIPIPGAAAAQPRTLEVRLALHLTGLPARV